MFVQKKSSALSPGETETCGLNKDWRRRKEGLAAQVVSETHLSNRATLNKSFKPNHLSMTLAMSPKYFLSFMDPSMSGRGAGEC